MTDDEARTSRRTYLALGSLALVSGIPILLVTLLKGLYTIADQQSGFGSDRIKAIVVWIYNNGIFVPWLWPWMSDRGFGGASNIASPSFFVGAALLGIAVPLFGNASRLKRWINEVTELLAKKSMAASRRMQSSQQSIGNVQSGRDTNLTQQITNHYNHRLDNPWLPIIVAIIGAAAAIAAALIKSGQ